MASHPITSGRMATHSKPLLSANYRSNQRSSQVFATESGKAGFYNCNNTGNNTNLTDFCFQRNRIGSRADGPVNDRVSNRVHNHVNNRVNKKWVDSKTNRHIDGRFTRRRDRPGSPLKEQVEFGSSDEDETSQDEIIKSVENRASEKINLGDGHDKAKTAKCLASVGNGDQAGAISNHPTPEPLIKDIWWNPIAMRRRNTVKSVQKRNTLRKSLKQSHGSRKSYRRLALDNMRTPLLPCQFDLKKNFMPSPGSSTSWSTFDSDPEKEVSLSKAAGKPYRIQSQKTLLSEYAASLKSTESLSTSIEADTPDDFKLELHQLVRHYRLFAILLLFSMLIIVILLVVLTIPNSQKSHSGTQESGFQRLSLASCTDVFQIDHDNAAENSLRIEDKTFDFWNALTSHKTVFEKSVLDLQLVNSRFKKLAGKSPSGWLKNVATLTALNGYDATYFFLVQFGREKCECLRKLASIGRLTEDKHAASICNLLVVTLVIWCAIWLFTRSLMASIFSKVSKLLLNRLWGGKLNLHISDYRSLPAETLDFKLSEKARSINSLNEECSEYHISLCSPRSSLTRESLNSPNNKSQMNEKHLWPYPFEEHRIICFSSISLNQLKRMRDTIDNFAALDFPSEHVVWFITINCQQHERCAAKLSLKNFCHQSFESNISSSKFVVSGNYIFDDRTVDVWNQGVIPLTILVRTARDDRSKESFNDSIYVHNLHRLCKVFESLIVENKLSEEQKIILDALHFHSIDPQTIDLLLAITPGTQMDRFALTTLVSQISIDPRIVAVTGNVTACPTINRTFLRCLTELQIMNLRYFSSLFQSQLGHLLSISNELCLMRVYKIQDKCILPIASSPLFLKVLKDINTGKLSSECQIATAFLTAFSSYNTVICTSARYYLTMPAGFMEQAKMYASKYASKIVSLISIASVSSRRVPLSIRIFAFWEAITLLIQPISFIMLFRIFGLMFKNNTTAWPKLVLILLLNGFENDFAIFLSSRNKIHSVINLLIAFPLKRLVFDLLGVVFFIKGLI